MNDYQPGRVYSGIIDGKRQIIFRDGEHWHHVDDDGNLRGGGYASNRNYTDVRGPLVVLDDPDERLADSWRLLADFLRQHNWTNVADQIEEQTRPPLQVGWHEVSHENGVIAARYWDHGWCHAVGTPDATQEWTSTHYIGPGSDQS